MKENVYEELTEEDKLIYNYHEIKHMLKDDYNLYSEDELLNNKENFKEIKEKLIKIKEKVNKEKHVNIMFLIFNAAWFVCEICAILAFSLGSTFLIAVTILNVLKEGLVLGRYFTNGKIEKSCDNMCEIVDEEVQEISKAMLNKYNQRIEKEKKNLPKYMENNRFRYEYEEEMENSKEDVFSM